MRADHNVSLRTKQMALRIIKLVDALPKTIVGNVIGKQIIPSGTSVGAQFREAKRARSKAEFLSKVQSAMQELEKTSYWLELLVESKIVESRRLDCLIYPS